MADIFSFEKADYGIGFKESGEAILIGEDTQSPLFLVQQWSINYQQQITPLFECGTSTVYFTAKHASGEMTISRVVYEDPQKFLSDLGQVCSPKSFTLTAYTGRCGNRSGRLNGTDQTTNLPVAELPPVKLEIRGMVAQSIGFSGQAQQAYVSENISTMFAALNVTN